MAGWVIENGEPVLLPEAGDDERFCDEVDQITGFVTRSMICAPLRVGEATIGVVEIINKLQGEFSADDLRLLSALANQVAIAIKNARLYQELQDAYHELQTAQDRLLQDEKLRALGQMASGIAHNFNNILSVIMGRAQLALRAATDETVKQDLQGIIRSSRDGAAMVHRLRDFTLTRDICAALLPVDVNEVVRATVEVTAPRWKNQMESEGRLVEMVIEPGGPAQVAGNPAQLREVLTNMIFNALDAMPEGGAITIKTWAEGEEVFVSVSDTGVGMSEEVRRRIFDPFFTTKGARNTGLGLSTALGIVARHGGQIEVQSELGQGTTFTIRLPAADFAAEVEEGVGFRRPSVRRWKVLVIDDEEEVCEVVSRVLGAEGHQVTAALSGREGVDAFCRDRHDLVITDLGMPEMSGYDVVERIREVDPQVTLVILTGWGEEMDDERVSSGEVAAVIRKPFDIDEFLEMITNLLSQTDGERR